jgi:hypothetical protein
MARLMLHMTRKYDCHYKYDVAFSVLISTELAIILQIMEVFSLEEEAKEELGRISRGDKQYRAGCGCRAECGCWWWWWSWS